MNNIYRDTEQVLREIARDTGMLSKFDQWLSNTGYVPETLFYSMIGWPERIVLQDAEISKMQASWKT